MFLARRIFRRRGFLQVWLLAFAGLLAMTALWNLATPLTAAPDEPAHFIRAAAVVRGEWIGKRVPNAEPAYTSVEVPAEFGELSGQSCFAFHPATPAGCAPKIEPGGQAVKATTYVGHYPPLYYLLVGWPSLIGNGVKTLYAMRALGSVVSMAMLALAFATARSWSTSRYLLPAVGLAATPMTLFLSSVVNPSGLEITSAITLWTSASVLALDYPENPPTGLIAVLGASTIVTVLSRSLSLLWPLLVVLVLLPVLWRRLPLASLARRWDVRGWAAGVVAAAIAALAWVLKGQALTVVPQNRPAASTSDGSILATLLVRSRLLFRESIGVFGWLDTSPPASTVIAWSALLVAVVAGALLFRSTLRRRLSILLSLVLSLGIPILLAAASVRHDGVIGQGKDFLPLFVAVPIVAGASLRPRQAGRPERVLPVVAWVAIWTAQAGAFFWALRRYLVGTNGPLSPAAQVQGGWRPPVPATALDLAMILVSGLFAWAMIRVARTAGVARPSVRPGARKILT